MYLQCSTEPTQEQDKARVQAARLLASLAVRALIEEAELTPKPALVDEHRSANNLVQSAAQASI
jgi:triphosphoribosyl-dephospho-CoA synthetase